MSAYKIKSALRRYRDPEKAAFLPRFFKTGPGQYGEGDRFLGITVPNIRKAVKPFEGSSHGEVKKLLESPFHEDRMAGLLILVAQFQKGDAEMQERVFRFYWQNRTRVNNWDLVDLSAAPVVGGYLWRKSKTPLRQLVRSPGLWDRRIAIVATHYFIKQDSFRETFSMARALLTDEHDLIHKAVGWMLREVGKRDVRAEEEFLQRHYSKMPRTMLRYAIERFPEPRRQAYLQGTI